MSISQSKLTCPYNERFIGCCSSNTAQQENAVHGITKRGFCTKKTITWKISTFDFTNLNCWNLMLTSAELWEHFAWILYGGMITANNNSFKWCQTFIFGYSKNPSEPLGVRAMCQSPTLPGWSALLCCVGWHLAQRVAHISLAQQSLSCWTATREDCWFSSLYKRPWGPPSPGSAYKWHAAHRSVDAG